jgi:ribosome-associated protein
VLLDLRPQAVIADFFVLTNGNSDRQIKALSENIRDSVKQHHGLLPYSIEGTAESGWMLMDYGEVIVHLFSEERRTYYDLEGLWRGESKVVLSIQ